MPLKFSKKFKDHAGISSYFAANFGDSNWKIKVIENKLSCQNYENLSFDILKKMLNDNRSKIHPRLSYTLVQGARIIILIDFGADWTMHVQVITTFPFMASLRNDIKLCRVTAVTPSGKKLYASQTFFGHVSRLEQKKFGVNRTKSLGGVR